jgi:hypothetical protein
MMRFCHFRTQTTKVAAAPGRDRLVRIVGLTRSLLRRASTGRVLPSHVLIDERGALMLFSTS